MSSSSFRAEHFPLSETAVEIEEYARRYPFSYDASEVPDLGRTVERHYPDPEHQVDLWARRFVEETEGQDTLGILTAMTRAIQADFTYNARDEMGTQEPVETLRSGTGTCRDYALLMMEAARSLGFAARLCPGISTTTAKSAAGLDAVSAAGDPCLGAALSARRRLGTVRSDQRADQRPQPDPGGDLRDPSQAVPLKGSFTGKPGDFLGMDVSVAITADFSADAPAGTAPVDPAAAATG